MVAILHPAVPQKLFTPIQNRILAPETVYRTVQFAVTEYFTEFVGAALAGMPAAALWWKSFHPVLLISHKRNMCTSRGCA